MTRSERTMAIVVAITNAGLFPFFTVALPLWVAKGLGASASMMAAIEVAFSLGVFIDSALLTTRVNKLIGKFNAVVCGNGLLGAGKEQPEQDLVGQSGALSGSHSQLARSCAYL
jgi:DHA3 family macrolide efflux protein-like MFS transporter